MSKVIVIGAGASGLAAAIMLSRNNNEVIILERNNICGKKLLITGSGRCNYFNSDFTTSHFNSSNRKLLESIINDKSKDEVLDFFNSIGIIPTIKEGYYYPYSNQASSIKNALEKEVINSNVRIIYNTYVKDIVKNNNEFIITTDNKTYNCEKVVVATGSKAYKKTGSEGNLYEVLKKLGHNIIKPLPALVQLKAEEKYLKEWKNIRTKATLKLYENNKFIKEEIGEVQLTDYGISGICTMNLSSIVARSLDQGKKIDIEINFYNELNSIDSFINFMNSRDILLKNRTISELLEGIMNYKLANLLIKLSNININSKWSNLKKEEKVSLAKNIISHKLNIIGTNSFDTSQTCSGGVALFEVNLDTMESKIIDGLYLIGEILDVDGECGGYNLGFCFITGIKAGNSIK